MFVGIFVKFIDLSFNLAKRRIRTDPRIYEIHTSTYLFFAIP